MLPIDVFSCLSVGLKTYPNTHWGRHNRKVDSKVKFGLKGPDQILKARIEQEKKKSKQRRKFKKSKKKKKKKNNN